MRHLILSRFNIRSPGREQGIRSRPGWLEERLELFDRYCLSSVASQTNKNFEWFIYFDEETDPSFIEKIAQRQAVAPFSIMFTARYMMTEIAVDLVASLGVAGRLLTTRLDTDDVIGADFVQRLHVAASGGGERTVYNFSAGLILSIADDGTRLYRYKDENNQFSSLLETVAGDGCRTIFGEKHRDIDKLGTVRQVGGRPAWMQVVHGGNVSNAVHGTRIPLGSFADTFPLLRTVRPEGSGETRGSILRDNVFGRARRSYDHFLVVGQDRLGKGMKKLGINSGLKQFDNFK